MDQESPAQLVAAGMQHGHTDQVARVLALVVQHSSTQVCGIYLQDVCSLLQTCSTVCSAMQQTGAQYGMTLYCKNANCNSLFAAEVSQPEREGWLASFSAWLPSHRSLVKAITLGTSQSWPSEQQLAVLLRLCRLQAAADALASVHLQAFRAHDAPMPALAGELAFMNLTELQLVRIQNETRHILVLSKLLQQLTGLQSLLLLAAADEDAAAEHPVADSSVMAVIAQLTRLTRLELGPFPPKWAAQLPPALQYLDITLCGEAPGSDIADMRHLVSLTQLYWADPALFTAELFLPPVLTTIGDGDSYAQNIPPVLRGGCGLQLLSAFVDLGDDGLRFLPCLASLPCLSTVRLKLVDSIPFTQGAFEQAAAAVGAITGLTCLAMALLSEHNWHHMPIADWCAPLSRLPRLCSLTLDDFVVSRKGMLQLSALTSLTRLYMCNAGLNNTMAVALALRMTNLQHLHVTGQFCGPVLMPAVATLTNLRRLYVHGTDDHEESIFDQELLMLTGLSQLSYLNLRDNLCSEGAKQRLVEQLPELSEVLDSSYDDDAPEQTA